MEKGRGVVAEVLIKWGKMQIGDCVVMGSTYGKVYEIHVCKCDMLTDRLRSFSHLLHSYANFSLAGESHGGSLG